MGGHGGLNILPQKSWHVYNRDNRLKVAQDEAEYEKEQKEKREQHQKAESEHRRLVLLARARGQTIEETAAPQAEPQQEQQIVERKTDALEHINFFREDEARLANPEAQAEKREERKQRGAEATQTSDARFDARFRLGHGMAGEESQPWYSRPAPILPAEEPDYGQAINQYPGIEALPGAHRYLEDGDHGNTGRSGQKSSHKKDKKKKKGHKEEKSKSRRDKAKSLEQLREERRAREMGERARERRVVLESTLGSDAFKKPKK